MTQQIGQPGPLALTGATTFVASPGYYSPLRTAVEGVFRQRWIFLGLILMVLASAATVSLIKKKQFKSEMQLLVQGSRSNAVISADRSSVAPVQDVREAQINSEIQVLQSEDVIGAVVDPTWNAADHQQKSQQEIQEHESKISGFLQHMTAEASNKSDVITVSLMGESPQEASAQLQKLTAAYLARRQQISRPAGASAFFAEETKRYKDAWDKANADMVEFQQAHGLVSVPDVEEALSQQIVTTQNELQAAQASLAESEQRVSASGRLAAQVPERQPTQQRLSPNQGAIQQTESLLLQLKNKRTELLTRFQPTDRLVQEVDHEIEDSNDALTRLQKARDKDETTDVNPAWQQVRNGEVQAIVEKRANESRIASLGGDLSKLHVQLAQIQPLAIKFNELQERVDQARNNFEIFSQKRDQSKIEDAMDERKLVNIAVVENPTMNFRQVAPRPLLYMILGAITALFLAGSAVYGVESFRSTIATRRELATISRYPVLASVPLDSRIVDFSPSGLTLPVIAGDHASMLKGRSRFIPAVQNFDDAQGEV